jgi:hypothetical protein
MQLTEWGDTNGNNRLKTGEKSSGKPLSGKMSHYMTIAFARERV